MCCMVLQNPFLDLLNNRRRRVVLWVFKSAGNGLQGNQHLRTKVMPCCATLFPKAFSLGCAAWSCKTFSLTCSTTDAGCCESSSLLATAYNVIINCPTQYPILSCYAVECCGLSHWCFACAAGFCKTMTSTHVTTAGSVL